MGQGNQITPNLNGIPYLFDGALLQMLLHCFSDEKLLLVELHPWVFLHNVFHDGLVRKPRPVVTRLQRNTDTKSFIQTLKRRPTSAASDATPTHRDGFDEDVVDFVLSACEVGDGQLFAGADARPGRNRPFDLLDLGLFVLVAVLQPGAKHKVSEASRWCGSDISL